MTQKITIENLRDEIIQLKKKNLNIAEDGIFVMWFLQAYLVDNLSMAKESLTGHKGDKNIDAIYIDERAKQVHIIQGKYRNSINKNEKKNDILAFSELTDIAYRKQSDLDIFFDKLDQLTASKLKEAIKRIKFNNYELQLYYITTGKCSIQHENEAKVIVRKLKGNTSIHILDHSKVLLIFKNYLNDVTPHVPELKLRIVPDGVIANEGVISRYDPNTKIESWIFTVAGHDVGEIYNKVGRRIFARNIRGFLGEETDTSKEMRNTIKNEPHNFWYYNNGVTMVCDEARREIEGGKDLLIIEGAQIINGQQTTRTLANENSQHKGANLLIKIIKIPRNPNDDVVYDRLVNSIVRATNNQNAVATPDLRSNDYIQIFLEREFRKKGYQYIRKKMSKGEAKAHLGSFGFIQIKKDELAQAVAACSFDPAILRKGKENLFDAHYYNSIFQSVSLSFYLSRFWLMKQIQKASKGYPERAYAKWVALNIAWEIFSPSINRIDGESKFRYACENKNEEVLTHLNDALVFIFREIIRFYKINRGKGEKAIDISTFFKKIQIHNEFKKHFNSDKVRKVGFKKNISDFDKKLKEQNIEL
jgi:hypothetical protein